MALSFPTNYKKAPCNYETIEIGSCPYKATCIFMHLGDPNSQSKICRDGAKCHRAACGRFHPGRTANKPQETPKPSVVYKKPSTSESPLPPPPVVKAQAAASSHLFPTPIPTSSRYAPLDDLSSESEDELSANSESDSPPPPAAASGAIPVSASKLAPLADEDPVSESEPPKPHKILPCRFETRRTGACMKGKSCTYMHGNDPGAVNCKHGEKCHKFACTFFHPNGRNIDPAASGSAASSPESQSPSPPPPTVSKTVTASSSVVPPSRTLVKFTDFEEDDEFEELATAAQSLPPTAASSASAVSEKEWHEEYTLEDEIAAMAAFYNPTKRPNS